MKIPDQFWAESQLKVSQLEDARRSLESARTILKIYQGETQKEKKDREAAADPDTESSTAACLAFEKATKQLESELGKNSVWTISLTLFEHGVFLWAAGLVLDALVWWAAR